MLLKEIIHSDVMKGFVYSTLLKPDVQRYTRLHLTSKDSENIKTLQIWHCVLSILLLISTTSIMAFVPSFVFVLLSIITILVAMTPTLLYLWFLYKC